MSEPRTTSGKVSNRMSSGVHPGLPAPIKHVPFGGDCPYQDAVGLKLAHLEIVLALLAFAACGECSSSVGQLNAKLKRDVQSEMSRIRGDWVKKVGKVKGSSAGLWAATERAKERLGFKDWKPMLQAPTEEAEAEADADDEQHREAS